MRGLGLLLLAGCAGASSISNGVPVREAYAGDRDWSLQFEDSSPLAARKEIPVYYPPEIFAVYVPGRVSARRDIFVGEHWVFLKIKDGSWFPEKLDEEIRARGKASDADIEKIRRSLAGQSWVVPHE